MKNRHLLASIAFLFLANSLTAAKFSLVPVVEPTFDSRPSFLIDEPQQNRLVLMSEVAYSPLSCNWHIKDDSRGGNFDGEFFVNGSLGLNLKAHIYSNKFKNFCFGMGLGSSVLRSNYHYSYNSISMNIEESFRGVQQVWHNLVDCFYRFRVNGLKVFSHFGGIFPIASSNLLPYSLYKKYDTKFFCNIRFEDIAKVRGSRLYVENRFEAHPFCLSNAQNVGIRAKLRKSYYFEGYLGLNSTLVSKDIFYRPVLGCSLVRHF